MNIYDKKEISCSACGRFIGEIDYKAKVAYPLCGKCAKKEDKISKTGIKKILVPLDDSLKSTRALDTSVFLAKHFGAKITALHVIPDVPYGGVGTLKKFRANMKGEAAKIIQSAKNYCSKKEFSIAGKAVFGDEVDLIVKTAKSGHYDLVVMGSSGKGAIKEAMVGSISNKVLRKSTIPILIVKESSKKLKVKP